MGNESCLSNSNESGSRGNSISIPNCSQRPVKENFVKLKIIENYPLHTIRSEIPLLYILPKVIKSSTKQKARQT